MDRRELVLNPLIAYQLLKAFSYSEVLPLQLACPHAQSTSGVFSIAAHSVLQYLPDVITHEQTG